LAATERPRRARLVVTRASDAGDAVIVLRGVVTRGAVRVLPRRARPLLEQGVTDQIAVDVAALEDVDATTVEALARLQLAARAAGKKVVIRRARPDLRALIDFMGLADALPPENGSDVETRRKPE
jgi:ABC-type transporter Mla MlaB component